MNKPTLTAILIIISILILLVKYSENCDEDMDEKMRKMVFIHNSSI